MIEYSFKLLFIHLNIALKEYNQSANSKRIQHATEKVNLLEKLSEVPSFHARLQMLNVEAERQI